MFERRLKVLLFVLVLITAGLILRAFAIQVVGKSHWEEESTRAMADQTPISTTRGRILDFKGRDLAIDRPCMDVSVDYRAVTFEPDTKWARAVARQRLVRRDEHFGELPRSKRKELIDAEFDVLKRDINAMWHELARLSKQTPEQMDENRRQIIRLVETRRRIVWYNKYERAVKNQQGREGGAWYSWLMGDNANSLDIDKYDVSVAEQTQTHKIIPNAEYDISLHFSREIERYPGLVIEKGLVRSYPYQQIGCHVIGSLRPVEQKELVDREVREKQTLEESLRNYLASDRIGRAGLEAMLEDRLRGARGIEVRDGMDNTVKQVANQPGEDVRTTIDIVLQAQIEEAFKQVKFVPYSKAPTELLQMNGAAVVIDIKSGEVRAMASYPTFDLNRFDDLYPTLAMDAINRPMANRATRTALEPGSTVKPLVGIGAITSGLIGPTDTIECTGYLVLGNQRYRIGRCWTMSQFSATHKEVPSGAPHQTGFLTFAEALERSCNIYHEELGDKLGIEGISRWYREFGLGKPTGVGLPEASGMVPDQFEGPASRRRSESWLASIGQGHVAATPMQMANIAATIARDGVSMQPHLTPGEQVQRIPLKVNAEAMRQAKIGMTQVVNGPAGTGTQAQMTQFLVACKTGSAQSASLRIPRLDARGEPVKDARNRVVWDPITLGTHSAPNPIAPWYRGISETEDKVSSHAWMIGFAPAENPKIAFAVMVEYGGGGGAAAGSVVHKLLEAAIEQGYLPSQQ